MPIPSSAGTAIRTFLRDFLHDARHALRTMRARPGFTAAVVLTLAIGIGATTAIFSVVSGVLLRPLAFENESRLFSLGEQYPGAPTDWFSISPPNVEDIVARSSTIDALGIGRGWSAHMTTPAGAEPVDAGIATPGMFRALGQRVVRGRMIDSTDLLGRPSDVALITWEMWQGRFAGDTGIVGRTLLLDDHPVRIVGVLQPAFHLPLFESIELWRPLHIDPRDEQNREWRGFVAYGRLKPNVSLARARAELASIAASIHREHFADTPVWSLQLMPLRDLLVRHVRPALLVFLGAVALVLLIACANVGNLLLARAATRGREMALRAALGAGRGRIVRALLAESAVLAGAGAAAGIALAAAAVRAFRALAPAGIPRVDEVRLDATVVVFAALLGLVTAVVVGLTPALRAARVDLAQALREGGRGGSGRRSRLSTTMVVVELAMAVLLTAGAGTLARSFIAFTTWNPGFERDHLALFTLSPAAARYKGPVRLGALWDRVEGALGAIPGVTAVGMASAGPLFGGRETWEMELEGYPPEQKASVRWYDVSPGFHAALGVPLRAGRALDSHDVPGGPAVCLVNETLVRRYWPLESPLGKRIVFRIGKEHAAFTVVGVVADVPSVRPGVAVQPEMYWSNRQEARPYSWVLVRTAVPPGTVAGAIRSAVTAIDGDLDARRITTMHEQMDRELASPRFYATLIVTFGAVALLLAAIGTYGLLAYTVTLRRREIGIRLAIGARRGDVVRDVAYRGLRMVGAGLAVGLSAYIALGRSLASLAPGIPPHDPWTLAATTGVLLVVALAACAMPAWRASRVDPAMTLGAE